MTTLRPPDTPASAAVPPSLARRLVAEALDLALLAVPAGIGLLLVQALADANGGGQTDRVVFGGTALAATVGLQWWNRG
ncbi:iron ABC transporter, partial [Rhodococcus sp. ENV425]